MKYYEAYYTRGHTERDDASLSKFSAENYAGLAYDMPNKVFRSSKYKYDTIH